MENGETLMERLVRLCKSAREETEDNGPEWQKCQKALTEAEDLCRKCQKEKNTFCALWNKDFPDIESGSKEAKTNFPRFCKYNDGPTIKGIIRVETTVPKCCDACAYAFMDWEKERRYCVYTVEFCPEGDCPRPDWCPIEEVNE